MRTHEKPGKRKGTLTPEPNRVPRWVMPLIKTGVVAADALLALVCFSLAFYLREGSSPFSDSILAWSPEFAPYAGVALFVMPVRVLVLMYQRAYRFSGVFSYVAETIKIFKATLTGSLFIIAFTFIFRGGFEFREFSYSRGIFVFDFLLALGAFTLFHISIRYIQSLVRRADLNLIPTLIVGVNKEAGQTVKVLRERPELGYRVVGVVEGRSSDLPEENDTGASEEGIAARDYEVIGVLEELPKIIRQLEIQEVIITDDSIPGEALFEAMMELGKEHRVEFRLAPSIYNFMPQKTAVEQIGILPMVRLFREPLSEAERLLKRVSDIAISAVSIILLAPVWVLSAVFIKLDSKGSILFTQERVGMDGRKFALYKFRTMGTNANEEMHREAYRRNIEGDRLANAGDHLKPVFGKVRDDPRVTRVGKILRRVSLDEIPQFLNVLMGDMSIVGPRPPIPYEVEVYKIWHRKRLDMKPGITGLWQVSGRNRLPFEEMVRMDLYYIENWSLWLDLRIIFLTIPAMLRGDGEN